MDSQSGKRRIYLDNNATTRCDPRVVEAMLPFFTEKYGNAASRNHEFGWEAEEAVEKARAQVAASIGADAKEIVFTSGATEADNLALKGVFEMYREKGDHIITVPTEHKAILDTAKHLETLGAKITWLRVGTDGIIDLDELRKAITDKTILISVMAVNNEVGVVQPLAEIGKIAAERGVLFHTDAVQAVGKVPVDVGAMGIHLLRCPATRSTARRASAHSTSAAATRASASRSRCTGAATSAAIAPARSPRRSSSASARPANWPPRTSRPARSSGSACCATACSKASGRGWPSAT